MNKSHIKAQNEMDESKPERVKREKHMPRSFDCVKKKESHLNFQFVFSNNFIMSAEKKIVYVHWPKYDELAYETEALKNKFAIFCVDVIS